MAWRKYYNFQFQFQQFQFQQFQSQQFQFQQFQLNSSQKVQLQFQHVNRTRKRLCSREKSAPDRLVVTRNGKSYVDAVNHNLVKAERAGWGKEDVSGRCGRGVQHCQCQAACHLRGQALVHANLSRMVLNSVYEL